MPAKKAAATVDPKLLSLLVCPLTHGPLQYDVGTQQLVSPQAQLAYPIRDGIPVLIPEEADPLDSAKKSNKNKNINKK